MNTVLLATTGPTGISALCQCIKQCLFADYSTFFQNPIFKLLSISVPRTLTKQQYEVVNSN